MIVDGLTVIASDVPEQESQLGVVEPLAITTLNEKDAVSPEIREA